MYAIYGGSFNPLTNGHLRTIKELQTMGFEKILVIPSGERLDKPELAPFAHRYKMAKLATLNMDKVEVIDIENTLPQPTKTYVTNRALKKLYPKKGLIWVIGADLIEEIKTWHNYQELVEDIKWLVHRRKGYKISKKTDLNIVAIIGKASSISGTGVRQLIKQQLSVRGLVNERVSRYITTNGLYR